MNDTNYDKFMIGTAQWGLPYGKYNKIGKCNSIEIDKMVRFMRKNQIKDIDTSFLYGNAHSILEKLPKKHFDIYTKLKIDTNLCDIEEVPNILNNGAFLRNIRGLSIHNSEVIEQAGFEKVIEIMINLSEKYGISKLGISIYEVDQLEQIYKIWTPDIIQIPLNYFNNSFIKSGAIEFIKSHGTIIHARSLFCQGMLLQSPEQSKLKDEKYLKIFHEFCEWSKGLGLSQLEACLSLIKSIPYVDKFVLGFERYEQLIEVCDAYMQVDRLTNIPDFHAPAELYDPRLWAS